MKAVISIMKCVFFVCLVYLFQVVIPENNYIGLLVAICCFLFLLVIFINPVELESVV